MVNGEYSDWDTIEYGVPQGSTLGPLLFILFTNDMCQCIRNSNVLLYADDTVIYRSDIDSVRNYRNIQGDLNRVFKWCNTNGLTINIPETKIVYFGTKKLRIIKELRMNKEILMYEKQYKYLGIILDANLNLKCTLKKF